MANDAPNRLDRIETALDRLTERQDALAQSVELTVSMHRDSQQRLAALATQTEERFARTLAIIERLAATAESHERRLDRLEGHN